jgi:hypothetical protein
MCRRPAGPAAGDPELGSFCRAGLPVAGVDRTAIAGASRVSQNWVRFVVQDRWGLARPDCPRELVGEPGSGSFRNTGWRECFSECARI